MRIGKRQGQGKLIEEKVKKIEKRGNPRVRKRTSYDGRERKRKRVRSEEERREGGREGRGKELERENKKNRGRHGCRNKRT